MMKFQNLILILGILGLVGVLLVLDSIQVVEDVGKFWVLLVAGSKGMKNYRHQANIYHAYHLVREGGIKDEQIIAFHYNDIAGHPHNPFFGTVRHEHGGRDFYPGVPWDYTGTDVNRANVFDVLKGNRKNVGKNKKVILSNSTNCSHPSYSTNNGYYGPKAQSHSWATAFGRAWICDSEQHDRRTRSVGEQFNEVKWNLTRSIVMEFGAKDLKKEKLFRYQGFKKERFWWWWYR